MADIPSLKTLQAAWKRAETIHREHLAEHGVNLPPWGTAKAHWLAILIHRKGKPVHKDEIAKIVQKHRPDLGGDQQVRHLKRDGWDLQGTGGVHFIPDPRKPSPNHSTNLKRRQGSLSTADFAELKRAFDGCCATCGAKEGKEHIRHKGEPPVKLQKGHCDPDKALTSENTIPQCQYCNRAYKSDFVFAPDGFVRAVASERPVQRASKEVQQKIRKFLAEKGSSSKE